MGILESVWQMNWENHIRLLPSMKLENVNLVMNISYRSPKIHGVSTDYILGLTDEIEDKKAPPSTGEKPINEEAAAIGAQLYKILIDAGWVKPGEDITEKQQQFLQSIISLISNEFH